MWIRALFKHPSFYFVVGWTWRKFEREIHLGWWTLAYYNTCDE